MKTIGRILILLVAAFIVISVTYAVSQTTAVQSMTGNQMEPDGNEGQALPAELGSGQGSLPGDVTSRPAGGPEGGSFQVVTLGRNLLIVGTVVLVVQVLWLIGRQLKSIKVSTTLKVRPNPNRNI